MSSGVFKCVEVFKQSHSKGVLSPVDPCFRIYYVYASKGTIRKNLHAYAATSFKYERNILRETMPWKFWKKWKRFSFIYLTLLACCRWAMRYAQLDFEWCAYCDASTPKWHQAAMYHLPSGADKPEVVTQYRLLRLRQQRQANGKEQRKSKSQSLLTGNHKDRKAPVVEVLDTNQRRRFLTFRLPTIDDDADDLEAYYLASQSERCPRDQSKRPRKNTGQVANLPRISDVTPKIRYTYVFKAGGWPLIHLSPGPKWHWPCRPSWK